MIYRCIEGGRNFTSLELAQQGCEVRFCFGRSNGFHASFVTWEMALDQLNLMSQPIRAKEHLGIFQA